MQLFNVIVVAESSDGPLTFQNDWRKAGSMACCRYMSSRNEQLALALCWSAARHGDNAPNQGRKPMAFHHEVMTACQYRAVMYVGPQRLRAR